MKKVFDVNIEEYKLSDSDKIIINLKNLNYDNLTEIKCFKGFEEVIALEAKKINLIKVRKTIFLNLANLQILDLRENKLMRIPKNIQLLKKLKHLKLDDNQITYLPNFIGNLEKLEQLTISNNKLTSIPTSIQYLTKLKKLKLSNNQITSLPIEFGLLKSLECLYIDANHFTEIPTTLCYLKHLSELSFEWLEFIDPPFQKILKDNLGRTMITLIKNSLQELIKQGVLYCDYHIFVQKNSNSNTKRELEQEEQIDAEIQNKKMLKIFYAMEHNYYGVVNSLISSNAEYMKIKNSENKTLLYQSIQTKSKEIINLILTKIDLNLIPNAYIYLHKAIRMRDPLLTQKLLEMGVDVNSSDDQGATCFHILFSAFTKNVSKCSLIGDILLRYHPRLNVLNNDNWAPIHIAARRSAKECLIWILSQNKVLRSQGKEEFDINIKGKNKWTPLHLSVNGYRLAETLLLLNQGADVFRKNSDGKKPRKVANGNFLLTKLLRKYEEEVLTKRYQHVKEANFTSPYTKNNFTTIEDSSSIFEEEVSSFLQGRNSKIINSQSPIPSELRPASPNPKVKRSSNRINLIPVPSTKTKSTNVSSQNSNKTYNLNYHKEVILNCESSLVEKYEALMHIKMACSNHRSHEVENVVKALLESLNLNQGNNRVVFSDVLNLVLVNQLYHLLPLLQMLEKTIQQKEKELNSHLDETYYKLNSNRNNKILEMELKNVISVIKCTGASVKGANSSFINDSGFLSAYNSTRRNKKLVNMVNKNPPNLNFKSQSRSLKPKSSLKNKGGLFNHLSAAAKMKQISKYLESGEKDCENSKRVNTENVYDYDYSEMNEISQSLISYNNQIPKKLKDSIIDQSCNVIDSSISMFRYDNMGENDVLQEANDEYLTSIESMRTKTEDVQCDTMKPEEV